MKIVSVWVICVIGVKGLQHLIFNHSIETNFDNNNIYTLLSILTSHTFPNSHILTSISLFENLSDYTIGHFTLLFYLTILYRSYSQIITITENIAPNNERGKEFVKMNKQLVIENWANQ